jgi:Na+/proline symporter
LLVLYPFTPAEAGGEGFAAAREMLFVRGIEDLLPPGARGLMLVGLLAALASTVDTHLNWGASYWSNDVYDAGICRRLLQRAPRPSELVTVARLSNVLVLAIALVIMGQLGSIQEAWFLSLLFGAGMGSVLVLRWLWERINQYSELAAMAVSLVVAPLLLRFSGTDPDDEWIRLGVMALATTSAAVLAAWFAPPTDEATLTAFYRRVRPTGWWGSTARRCGDDPRAPLRALGRQLRDSGVAAASLFAVLAGAGRLLFPPPGSAAWISAAMLALGLLLVPFWVRAVRGEQP